MYEKEIEEGMKLLDEKEGLLWDQRIDTNHLMMDRCAYCILGQLYGWYSDGLESLELHESENYMEDASKYGFALYRKYPPGISTHEREIVFEENCHQYEVLGQEWIEAIIRRREARIEK